MNTAAILTLPLLTLASLFAIIRMIIGPTMLDRIIALEALVAIVASSLAAIAILSGNATLLPALAVLTLLGFAGAVSVARFSAREVRE